MGKRKRRLYYVSNADIWKEAHVYPMAETFRQNRLKWFGLVQSRDKDEAMRTVLQMAVDGKRNRGKPKRRWRDLVKERNHMTTEMTGDRTHWHVIIRASTLVSVEAER